MCCLKGASHLQQVGCGRQPQLQGNFAHLAASCPDYRPSLRCSPSSISLASNEPVHLPLESYWSAANAAGLDIFFSDYPDPEKTATAAEGPFTPLHLEKSPLHLQIFVSFKIIHADGMPEKAISWALRQKYRKILSNVKDKCLRIAGVSFVNHSRRCRAQPDRRQPPGAV